MEGVEAGRLDNMSAQVRIHSNQASALAPRSGCNLREPELSGKRPGIPLGRARIPRPEHRLRRRNPVVQCYPFRRRFPPGKFRQGRSPPGRSRYDDRPIVSEEPECEREEFQRRVFEKPFCRKVREGARTPPKVDVRLLRRDLPQGVLSRCRRGIDSGCDAKGEDILASLARIFLANPFHGGDRLLAGRADAVMIVRGRVRLGFVTLFLERRCRSQNQALDIDRPVLGLALGANDAAPSRSMIRRSFGNARESDSIHQNQVAFLEFPNDGKGSRSGNRSRRDRRGNDRSRRLRLVEFHAGSEVDVRLTFFERRALANLVPVDRPSDRFCGGMGLLIFGKPRHIPLAEFLAIFAILGVDVELAKLLLFRREIRSKDRKGDHAFAGLRREFQLRRSPLGSRREGDEALGDSRRVFGGGLFRRRFFLGDFLHQVRGQFLPLGFRLFLRRSGEGLFLGGSLSLRSGAILRGGFRGRFHFLFFYLVNCLLCSAIPFLPEGRTRGNQKVQIIFDHPADQSPRRQVG